jgi:hypothetical protein
MSMPSLRHETYYAGSFLVEQLWKQGIMGQMLHDGGDIILFETRTGKRVSMHLIESEIPLYEIRKTLTDNAAQDTYTLFLLWASMMLPHHGQHYRPEDWMEGLYTLYGNCIYGYDIFDSEAFVFPVYFNGTGRVRQVTYGTTVSVRRLLLGKVVTQLPDLAGQWLIADFNGSYDAARRQLIDKTLEAHYELLGTVPGDDRATIRRAYLMLARRYHPDTNSAADAHERMQRINEAYRRINAYLDSQA